MAKVTPNTHQLFGIALVRYNRSKPSQLIGGPGNTGKKLPNIPINIQIKPRSNNTISIVQMLDKNRSDLLQSLKKMYSFYLFLRIIKKINN